MNLSYCDWQNRLPKTNDSFKQEIEATQKLEHKPIVTTPDQNGDLSDCDNDKLILPSATNRNKRKKFNLSLRPAKKIKTANHSDSEDYINNKRNDESSDESMSLLTAVSQNQNNNLTNQPQSKQDLNDQICTKSQGNQNESRLEHNLDLGQSDNFEINTSLVKPSENNLEESSTSNLGSLDQALQNDQTKVAESLNDLRSNLILDLIESDQFKDLETFEILTQLPENQSFRYESKTNQTKSQDNDQTEKQESTQSSEALSNVKPQETRSDSPSLPIGSKSSTPNIPSSNHSDLELFTVKVEFDRTSTSSVDTIILNPSDNMILFQQSLCDKTGTFYQSFSIGNEQIDLIEGNEKDSDNDTEVEMYEDIFKNGLELNAKESKLLEQELMDTSKNSEIIDKDRLETELKQIEDYNDLQIQINSEETNLNLVNLQNTEEYQIALKKNQLPVTHIQLSEPCPEENVEKDSELQETCETELKLEIKVEELSQSFIDTQLLDEVLEPKIPRNKPDQVEQTQAALIEVDQVKVEVDVYNDLELNIAMVDLDKDEIKLEELRGKGIETQSEFDLLSNTSEKDLKISSQAQLKTGQTETQLESVASNIESEESDSDDTDQENRKEAFNRLYCDTSDECEDLSSSASSMSYSSLSSESSRSESSMSEIEIVLDPRQRNSDSDDDFNTDQSSQEDTISTHLQNDPKLLQQCRIQLDKRGEDLEIKRLTNLNTLDKTIRPRNSASIDRSIKFKPKKSKKNSISDDSDNETPSLVSDVSDVPEYEADAIDLNSSIHSPVPQDVSFDDTDVEDGFDQNLLESEPVTKPKKASKNSTKIGADEIDPNSEWKKDSMLTGALNDSDSTNDSIANILLEKLNNGKTHKKNQILLDDSDSSDCLIIGTKKRKRTAIKDSETDLDSDDSDVQFMGKEDFSDSLSFKSKNKGRHNIREVLPDSLLQAETQQADKEEAERRKRIDQKNKSLEVVLSQSSFNKDQPQLVLDWDDKLKEPLVSVNPVLIPILKSHQLNGIKFMWDNCFESISRLKDSKGAGCILAHCMGLGKTMQIVVLAHTILTHPVTKVKHILVLCPLTTVFNWCNEFKITLKNVPDKLKIYFITPDRFRSFSRKVSEIKQWRKTGGVLIISYDTFKSILDTKRTGIESSKDAMNEALLDPGPDLVVCDEGHILKSGKTNIFMQLVKVKTARRIILTGTPMQNNLKEYYYMVNFVKPSLLGTFNEYTRCFINPIENGQYEDSSKRDINLMRKRSHVLHKKLETTVQRYEVKELRPYLPKKNEHVLFLQLSPVQIKLYNKYLKLRQNASYKKLLFQDFHNLRNIWTHPAMLQLKLDKKDEKSVLASRESEFDGITFPFDWFKDDLPDDLMTNLEHGPKMTLLFSIIKECEAIGEKLLVFSSSIIELDLIECFLKQTCMLNGEFWQKNRNYFRMDGAVLSDERSHYCDMFNDKNNKKIKLFLVSHKVGGLGLNLTAASRVVLMDVSWNPAYDSQSVFRVYRFGQERECFIYRFVSMGTMEEVVYSRAVSKLAVSCRVVDEQQISRHFKSDDLHRMYQLNLDFMKKRSTPILPPDRLLAKLWLTHDPILHNFCDHESLLENQTHEELNEEEMKNAWDEYHQEELFARDRTKGILDPMPSTSGLANYKRPLLETTPRNFLNVPFQINNPLQNFSTSNANYSHISQHNLAQNIFTANPNSNRTNPQQNKPTFNANFANNNYNNYAPTNTHNPYKNPASNSSNFARTTPPNILGSNGNQQEQRINPVRNIYSATSSNTNARFKTLNQIYLAPMAGNVHMHPNKHNMELKTIHTSKNIRANPLYQHNQNIPTTSIPVDLTHRYKKPVQNTNLAWSSEKSSSLSDSAPKNPGQVDNYYNALKELISKPKSQNADPRARAVPNDGIFQKALRKNDVSLSLLINDDPAVTTSGNAVLNTTRNTDSSVNNIIPTAVRDSQLHRIIQDPYDDVIEI